MAFPEDVWKTGDAGQRAVRFASIVADTLSVVLEASNEGAEALALKSLAPAKEALSRFSSKASAKRILRIWAADGFKPKSAAMRARRFVASSTSSL